MLHFLSHSFLTRPSGLKKKMITRPVFSQYMVQSDITIKALINTPSSMRISVGPFLQQDIAFMPS